MKPETKGKYPYNWHEISLGIRKERGWRCENCGTGPDPGSSNFLTVHHIDYDPSNNEPSNLIVLCAKCHLQRQHRERGMVSRREQIARGQLELPL